VQKLLIIVLFFSALNTFTSSVNVCVPRNSVSVISKARPAHKIERVAQREIGTAHAKVEQIEVDLKESKSGSGGILFIQREIGT
jgi:hypothetical protein